MERYDKIHVWIGNSDIPEKEYQEYFELDDEHDLDDPNYRVCQFCKDIGDTWYDIDFIGIIPRFKTPVSLDDLLEEAGIEEVDKAKKRCKELGITVGNAIFWYADGDLKLSKPLKETYNGLKYIGMYTSS